MSKVVIFNRKGKQSRGICYQSSAARGVLRRPGEEMGAKRSGKRDKGDKTGRKGGSRKQGSDGRETEAGRAGMVEGRTAGRAGNRAEKRGGMGRKKGTKRTGSCEKRKSEEVRKGRAEGPVGAKEKRRQSVSKKRVLRDKKGKLKDGKEGAAWRKKKKMKGRKGARSGQKTEAGRTGSGRCREPFGNTPFPARRDKKGRGP